MSKHLCPRPSSLPSSPERNHGTGKAPMGSEGTGLTVTSLVLTFITCRTCFFLTRRPGPHQHTGRARVWPSCGRAHGAASRDRLTAEPARKRTLTLPRVTMRTAEQGSPVSVCRSVSAVGFKHYSHFLHHMVSSVHVLETVPPPRVLSRPLLGTAVAGGMSRCPLPSRSLAQKLPDNTVSLKIKFKKLCFVVFSDIHMHIRFRCSYKRKDGF